MVSLYFVSVCPYGSVIKSEKKIRCFYCYIRLRMNSTTLQNLFVEHYINKFVSCKWWWLSVS